MKTCSKCKIEKDLDDFYKDNRSSNGRKSACKVCHYEEHQLYRANGGKEKERLSKEKRLKEDPSYGRNARYKRRYGITVDQYNQMLVEQGGKCKLCGQEEHIRSTSSHRKPKPLAVDHCHNTGKVRGLLCHNCNVMLGQYEKWKDKFPMFEEYIKGNGWGHQ